MRRPRRAGILRPGGKAKDLGELLARLVRRVPLGHDARPVAYPWGVLLLTIEVTDEDADRRLAFYSLHHSTVNEYDNCGLVRTLAVRLQAVEYRVDELPEPLQTRPLFLGRVAAVHYLSEDGRLPLEKLWIHIRSSLWLQPACWLAVRLTSFAQSERSGNAITAWNVLAPAAVRAVVLASTALSREVFDRSLAARTS